MSDPEVPLGEALGKWVPDKIPPLTKKTLFTMEGCPHCESALDRYKTQIEAGKIEVKHCNIDGTDKQKLNCTIAQNQPHFDGFPSMYAPDGKKLL